MLTSRDASGLSQSIHHALPPLGVSYKNVVISKGEPTGRYQLPTKSKQPHLKRRDCLLFIPNNNVSY